MINNEWLPISGRQLVVVSWDTHFLGDPLIFDRWLEHHAAVELVNHRTLDFLPRGLVGGEGEAALFHQGSVALGQLLVRNQDIGCPFFQVNTHFVAGLQNGQSAIGGCFR